MGGSIRVIKIVKDKNPVDGSEEEMYTVEIEVETDDAGQLAIELAKSPYGEQIMDLLQRAEFIPSKEEVAEKQEEDIKKHDKELMEAAIEEYRTMMIDQIETFLTEKGKPKIAEAIKKLFKEEEKEEETDAEDDM